MVGYQFCDMYFNMTSEQRLTIFYIFLHKINIIEVKCRNYKITMNNLKNKYVIINNYFFKCKKLYISQFPLF